MRVKLIFDVRELWIDWPHGIDQLIKSQKEGKVVEIKEGLAILIVDFDKVQYMIIPNNTFVPYERDGSVRYASEQL
jgi:hypothetical protein